MNYLHLLTEPDLSDPGTWLFYAAAATWLVQLIFLGVFYIPLLLRKELAWRPEMATPAVSVIIAARNEADNLAELIPLIMEQDYPEYEVIVVNHRSSDDTTYVMMALERQYKNLRLIDLKDRRDSLLGKKLPITVGVKGAKHEHLVFIDADCRPVGQQWLRKMANGFGEGKEIVLGFSPYARKKGLLNAMIRYDATLIGLNYMSFANSGMPYMGVGRNMGYKKELFDRVGGFKSHYHLLSGDDDLLVNQAGTRKNCNVVVQKDGHTISDPETSWKAWWRQKHRHFTTAPHYRLFHKLLLGTFPLSLLIMVVCSTTLLFDAEWWFWGLMVLASRELLFWLVWGILFVRLRAKDMVIYLPLIEKVHTALMPIMYLTTPAKRSSWR